MALLGPAAHAMEHRINDAPRQITPKGTHDHRVYIIGPTAATLSEPVRVKTVIGLKSTPAMRSLGSSMAGRI